MLNFKNFRTLSNYFYLSTLDYLYRIVTRDATKSTSAKSKSVFCATLLKMSPAVNAMYVRTYFTQLAKDSIRIVNNLKRQIRRMIKKSDRMGSATKIYALEKLNALSIQIGYAKDLFDDQTMTSYYSMLMDSWNRNESFTETVLTFNKWKIDKQFRQLLSKVQTDGGARYFDVISPNTFYDIDRNAVCKLIIIWC